mgnify:CR=1 FL=1
MKTITLTIWLFSLLSPLCNAQSNAANASPMQAIYNMFDAMREHNKEKFLQQFTKDALLQRINNQGEIKNADIEEFAQVIQLSDKHLDERLFSVTVQKNNKLASVWAPFIFYLDGSISHCGHNSFQLVKINQQWKIQYLIDSAYAGNCETFKDTLL